METHTDVPPAPCNFPTLDVTVDSGDDHDTPAYFIAAYLSNDHDGDKGAA